MAMKERIVSGFARVQNRVETKWPTGRGLRGQAPGSTSLNLHVAGREQAPVTLIQSRCACETDQVRPRAATGPHRHIGAGGRGLTKPAGRPSERAADARIPMGPTGAAMAGDPAHPSTAQFKHPLDQWRARGFRPDIPTQDRTYPHLPPPVYREPPRPGQRAVWLASARGRPYPWAMPILAVAELPGALAPRQRLLGLDVGEKTIGLAISDSDFKVAAPVDTIRRTKFAADAARLAQVIAERAVGGLIIGLPINMDGSEGPRCQSVRQFAANLLQRIALPIAFWDERLSTAAVTRAMLEADLSRAKRARAVDKMAAAYILQGALDALGRHLVA